MHSLCIIHPVHFVTEPTQNGNQQDSEHQREQQQKWQQREQPDRHHSCRHGSDNNPKPAWRLSTRQLLHGVSLALAKDFLKFIAKGTR